MLVLVEQFDLLSTMISNDVSYLSSIILFIFFFFTIKLGYELYHFKEIYLNTISFSNNLSSNLKNVAIQNFNSLDKLNNNESIVIVKYIKTVGIFSLQKKEINEIKNNFENNITSKLEASWFVVDLLLKLGLIGTVIGFIIMLSAITEIENFDLSLMNELLQSMSGGMKVALYTTLTGLITSILLSMQCKYFESLVYKVFHACNSAIPHIDDEFYRILNDEKTTLFLSQYYSSILLLNLVILI